MSAVTDTRVRVVHAVQLQPWSVMRCRLADPLTVGGATSVIVKWVRTEPGNERTQPGRLRTERAALEHVGARAPQLVPRVLAGGGDSGLLVLEDLAPREPLRELLLRVGPVLAEPQMIDVARALGRLHAATVGSASSYYERLGADATAGLATDIAASVGDFGLGVERVRAVGVPMSTAAQHELTAIVDTLLDPGALLALSNGDPETNNYLADGPDGRLIDFESAGFQHVFVDVASMYIPGPMWLTVGDPDADGRAHAYRAAVAAVMPAVTDDRIFGEGVTGAGFVEALRRLVKLPTMDARDPGESGRLHRVATTEAAADGADRFACLPHLTSWTRTVAALRRRRWPDTDVDLAALSPFTARWRQPPGHCARASHRFRQHHQIAVVPTVRPVEVSGAGDEDEPGGTGLAERRAVGGERGFADDVDAIDAEDRLLALGTAGGDLLPDPK